MRMQKYLERWLTYKRTCDMLEDYTCGPNDPEALMEYIEEEEERRDKEEKEIIDKVALGSSRLKRVMDGVGASITDDKTSWYKEYIQTEGQRGEIIYRFIQSNVNFARVADIYCELSTLFISAERAAQWMFTRTYNPETMTGFKFYYHLCMGAIKGISNATFMCLSRFGFKMLVPEWAPLPVGVPVCTHEYTDQTRTATREIPLFFGFKQICYDYDQNAYVAIAPERVEERYFPKYDLTQLPLHDPPPFPQPPGPTPDSPYGLAMRLFDPPIHEDIPYIMQGSGLTIAKDSANVSAFGVSCMDGLTIDSETGGVRVDTGDGLTRYPLVIDPNNPENVLASGGLGIEEELLDYMDDASDYLEQAENILEAIECIQRIDAMIPCC